MKTLNRTAFSKVKTEATKRSSCFLCACIVVLLVGCKIEPPKPPNTSPFTYWSEARGRVEFREFKKWVEDETRTKDALREKLGSPNGGTTNAAALNEKWIYKNRFYDKEPKLLISVFEIQIDTNGIVKRPLPSYEP